MIMPSVLLIGLVLWLVAFYSTRIVALASLLFALSLPITAALFYGVGHVCWAFVRFVPAHLAAPSIQYSAPNKGRRKFIYEVICLKEQLYG